MNDNTPESLAAEYVLGTLDAEARRAVAARLNDDPALQQEVAYWERRLAPLNALAGEEQPSELLAYRIDRSLDTLTEPTLDSKQPRTSLATTPTHAVAQRRWWNNLPLWQGASAALLLLSLALWQLTPAPSAPAYIVVLTVPGGTDPGWLVKSRDRRSVELLPLKTVEVPSDKVLQFWTKADGWQKPVSLGLVAPDTPLEASLEALAPIEANQLFELTIEQPGGSPTGLPTGPVQFIGRAVQSL